MKKSGLVIVIVALALIGAYVLFGGGGEKNVIQSDDGFVVLTIPDDALPEDFEMSMLTIDVLEGEVTPSDQNDFVTTKEIVLAPSGTTFNIPVNIAITTTYVPNASPVIFHIADDKTIEVFQDIVEEIDEENNTVTYSIQITHFSRISFLLYRRFVVIMDPPGDHVVGESFDVTTSIRKHEMVYESTDSDGYTSVISVMEDTILITEGTFIASGPVTPEIIAGNPHRASMNTDDYRVNETFRCTGSGTVSLIYSVVLSYMESVDIQNIVREIFNVKPQINKRDTGYVTLKFNCVDPTVLDEPPKVGEGADAELSQRTYDDTRNYIMLLIDGAYYPISQFITKNATEPEFGHRCLNERHAHALHYHPKWEAVGEVYGLKSLDALDIAITPDPNPEGCGFGLNDDIERLNIELTAQQQRELLKWMDSI